MPYVNRSKEVPIPLQTKLEKSKRGKVMVAEQRNLGMIIPVRIHRQRTLMNPLTRTSRE